MSLSAEKFRRDYWKDLIAFMQQHNILPNLVTPYKETFQVFKRWKGDTVRCATKLNRKLRWIHVDLTLKGDEGKRLFQQLRKEREAIEREIGAALQWEENPGKVESHIILRQYTDPSDRSQRSSQHAWLAIRLIAFCISFGPRVERLMASR